MSTAIMLNPASGSKGQDRQSTRDQVAVQSREGFIQKDERRLASQHPRQANTPRLTSGNQGRGACHSGPSCNRSRSVSIH